MKKGLIIQGPMFSPGYGPYEFQADGSFNKSWIDYNCAKNIQDTIEVAKEYFDHIVIATWRDDDYMNFLTSLGTHERVEIVLLDENERLSDLNRLGVRKYHQIVTLRAGASKLEELGCDVVAKIRTDHSVNLKLLSKQVKQHRGKSRKSLGVPNINLFELDRLTDFYFVGSSDVIRDLCDYYMSHEEFCADTHRDYFLNFLTYLSSDRVLVEKIQNSESQLVADYYCIFVWTHFFYPLRAALFKNFYWRGRLVNHRLNGWIRWFYTLHSSHNSFPGLKFLLNLISILLFREMKRPTIRLSSAILFRFYRFKARKVL